VILTERFLWSLPGAGYSNTSGGETEREPLVLDNHWSADYSLGRKVSQIDQPSLLEEIQEPLITGLKLCHLIPGISGFYPCFSHSSIKELPK
jgi:hypothetical protein